LGRQPHRLTAVRGFTDHGHAGDALKQKFQSGPDDAVIVRDQNANH
jgi:hypothetical protein